MYHDLARLVLCIAEPNRASCMRILEDHRKLFQEVPGSTHNHQTWPGGYWDHVCEVMNIATQLHRLFNSLRPLSFSLADALLVLFLHDLEKPWKYEQGEDGQLRERSEFKGDKGAQHEYRMRRLAEYGITLTDEQLNGLKYVEGELTDYSNRQRVMGPLAAFCHLCDVTSARIWFDHPLATADPWQEAERARD